MHMEYLLKDKTALILGASRGIGAATAKLFADHGARVMLTARTVDPMEQLAERIRANGGDARVVRTDMARAEDIRNAVAATVSAFGRLDIAVNNAGANHDHMPLADIPDQVFDAIMDVNARGVFIAMKAEIQAMRQAGGGSIVNTGSFASSLALSQMGAYVASKHAVAGLTRIAAADHARENIRVNMVAPGAVMTDMSREGLSQPEVRAAAEAATPMGRIAEPEDIAGAILWLCTPAAGYVTGATLPVDGGYSII